MRRRRGTGIWRGSRGRGRCRRRGCGRGWRWSGRRRLGLGGRLRGNTGGCRTLRFKGALLGLAGPLFGLLDVIHDPLQLLLALSVLVLHLGDPLGRLGTFLGLASAALDLLKPPLGVCNRALALLAFSLDPLLGLLKLALKLFLLLGLLADPLLGFLLHPGGFLLDAAVGVRLGLAPDLLALGGDVLLGRGTGGSGTLLRLALDSLGLLQALLGLQTNSLLLAPDLLDL